MTASQPPGRFGALTLASARHASAASARSQAATGPGSTAASSFSSPTVIDYIEGDATVWEKEPLQRLAHDGSLAAYKHDGFWQPMDTLARQEVPRGLWNVRESPLESVVNTRRNRIMKILITGNLGYVGPCVTRRLRACFPTATLAGLDTGYFAHCLTNASCLPETQPRRPILR